MQKITQTQKPHVHYIQTKLCFKNDFYIRIQKDYKPKNLMYTSQLRNYMEYSYPCSKEPHQSVI